MALTDIRAKIPVTRVAKKHLKYTTFLYRTKVHRNSFHICSTLYFEKHRTIIPNKEIRNRDCFDLLSHLKALVLYCSGITYISYIYGHTHVMKQA